MTGFCFSPSLISMKSPDPSCKSSSEIPAGWHNCLRFRAAEVEFSNTARAVSKETAKSIFYSSFLAFFFLFLLVLEPVDLAKGRSRILRISSSSIFLSVWNLDKSGWAGPASLVMPFLVMAAIS